ncbi:MAG TPA: NADH-quinone oxidoreductase subunit K, partial [Candidatus Kapabacteria bacterium]
MSFFPVGLNHFLVLSALLFVLGIFIMLTRRNAIAVLMGIELILNAANINFVAFSRYGAVNLGGHV